MIKLGKKTGIFAPIVNRHTRQKDKVMVQADQGERRFIILSLTLHYLLLLLLLLLPVLSLPLHRHLYCYPPGFEEKMWNTSWTVSEEYTMEWCLPLCSGFHREYTQLKMIFDKFFHDGEKTIPGSLMNSKNKFHHNQVRLSSYLVCHLKGLSGERKQFHSVRLAAKPWEKLLKFFKYCLRALF